MGSNPTSSATAHGACADRQSESRDRLNSMLTSSTRIAITCFFVAGLAIASQAVWLLLRGKQTLPVKRTVVLSVWFALLGAAQIVRADSVVAYPTWFYLSNASGLLLGVGGATYAATMWRSQRFTS
ncbi:MAG TPA: hypothetical protein VF608_16000 [Thermoanaerobaculia bacterium]